MKLAKLPISAHLTRLRSDGTSRPRWPRSSRQRVLKLCRALRPVRDRSHHGDPDDAQHDAVPGDCSCDGLACLRQPTHGCGSGVAERLRTACYAQRFDAISQRTQEDHRLCRSDAGEVALLQLVRRSPSTRPSADEFVEPLRWSISPCCVQTVPKRLASYRLTGQAAA